MPPAHGCVRLVPLQDLEYGSWRSIQQYFRDPEIAHLNGTKPNRLPVWLLRVLLLADSRRADRRAFGIHDETDRFIGMLELYDIKLDEATLGIIIGEKTHWSRGYGPEAIRAALPVAFGELQLAQVRLSTFGDNLRAQNAFRKVGFQEVRRGPSPDNPGREDVIMVLTREAWLSSSSAAVREILLDRAGRARTDARD